jgi:hypothetical protein
MRIRNSELWIRRPDPGGQSITELPGTQIQEVKMTKEKIKEFHGFEDARILRRYRTILA